MTKKDYAYAIFGAGNFGKQLKIEMDEKGYFVPFFVDNNVTNKDVSTISPLELKWRMSRREVDAVIIAVKDYYALGDIVFFLHEMGITKNIFVLRPEMYCTKRVEDFSLIEHIYPLDLSKKAIITKLEFHVCDHCNLNCKGCSHFAPIYDESFANIVSFEQDVYQLSRIFDNILRFRLMGGEPFLNKELPLFINAVRKFFPNSRIEIVTNGLVLEKVDESIWKAIREAKAILNISLYPPTHKILDSLIAFLDNKTIEYEVGSGLIQNNDSGIIEEFHKNLTMKNNHSQWIAASKCMGGRCHYLRNGKISKCAIPLLAEDINKYFGTNFIATQDDYVDIYDDVSPWEMARKLYYATPFCKYCSDMGTERFGWECSNGKKQEISDYVVK